MDAKAYHINSNLYHYAGNNPVKYTDPDGRIAQAIPLISIAIESIKDAAVIVGTALSVLILGNLATDIINDDQQGESENQKAEDAKEQLESNAQSVTPNPIPPDEDPNKNKTEEKSNQSAKDAKKLDNTGADNLAKNKGYNDAHELKSEYVKGLKDKKIIFKKFIHWYIISMKAGVFNEKIFIT